MRQNFDIILASGSPRRRELLTQAGLRFVVKSAEVDETPTETEPARVVEELSRRKAEAVAALEKETDNRPLSPRPLPRIIVAADTIVALDGEILGKPKDEEDAVRMLTELSGRTHQVYTGVTILPVDTAGGDKEPSPVSAVSAVGGDREPSPVSGEETENRPLSPDVTFSCCTRVTFYPLTEEEIRDYVGTGEPMDKAGAYGIQGLGVRLVERIEGDYNNVVGFPLAAFLRILDGYRPE